MIPENIKNFSYEGEGCKEIEKLKLLLAWFKTDFFKWTNNPQCSFCESKETEYKATQQGQTPEEIAGKANRVEIYVCKICDQPTKFPRYNDPKTLLSSRNGRCGEWANCFTLCCIAVGLKARLAVDFTDHIWTEVWSEKE